MKDYASIPTHIYHPMQIHGPEKMTVILLDRIATALEAIAYPTQGKEVPEGKGK